ncbi:MAG TPA: sulfite exporter TauE/SafE family protein, partial [Aliiroseovarius sp.]|nr:sulfite exporter TauE/SafE family protein [Aliiroseovarius sp.]
MDFLFMTELLSYGIFVGIVFSAIGAAGGILTSFGMISLFGVIDPNSVKPMTQIIVLVTALTFVPGYLRRSALVLPLGLLLGGGGLAGAYAGSTLSSLYLSDMSTFKPLFGVLTLLVAAQIIWKLVRGARSAAANPVAASVSDVSLTPALLRFSYGTTQYRIPTWSPVLAGALIAMIAAIFGVGGGFLLVPYMATILTMPM